ncbi:hypothetical protein LTR84_004359 [Exophiala bonariae]|uniref:Uncharacterized protein n=1 Tax=Exophiala bonariae TaxID=1690606 RepID=A0AAV9N5A5_9EURO|nr:hypothetical protein LTR84_004359 [Exophiala bonariae]
MPRGADYDDGVPRSDNAIEAGEDKAHGTGNNTTDEVELNRAKKTAAMPDLSEVNDRTASGGAATGHNDGHGHDSPGTRGEKTGSGLRKDFGRQSLNKTIASQNGSEASK